MRSNRRGGGRTAFSVLLILVIVLFSGGCAQLPPNQNNLSGKRLIVTMTFRSPINPLYHYYFLINNAGSQNAPGPIPVLLPPYGNGFATGSNGGTTGFTDFVVFDNLQPQGYGLYHVTPNTNPPLSQFTYTSAPLSFTTPDPTNPNTATKLQFIIDLSQIVRDANGNTFTNPTQAATAAKQIQWLQINIVATNILPVDVTTPVDKHVDSLGDTQTAIGATSFLTLNVQQLSTVQNSTSVGTSIYEPSTYDVYPPGSNDPQLDLVDWSIQVVQQ